MVAVMLAGALTVGNLSVSAFCADDIVVFGDAADTSEAAAEEAAEETEAEEAVETGYAEDACITEDSASTAETSSETAVEEPVSAPPDTAEATVTSYTVTLDANGGYFENEWDDELAETVEKSETIKKYISVGEVIKVLPSYTLGENVAEFAGWSTDRGGEAILHENEPLISSDIIENGVLFAVWDYGDDLENEGDREDAAPEENIEKAETEEVFADKADPAENNDTLNEDNDSDEDPEDSKIVEEETSAAEEIMKEIDEEETAAISSDSQAGERESIPDLESPGLEDEKNTVTADSESETGETARQSAATSNNKLSGKCGPDAYWEIDNHVMTINGTGEITGNPFDSYNLEENGIIKAVVIQEGITSLCDNAFKKAPVLEIILPDTMKDLGEGAFRESTLMKIKIPDGITGLPDWAFYRCKYLQEIELPESLETIGEYAVRECKKLEEIIIPSKVRSVGKMAFSYDDNLKRIVFTGDCPEFDQAGFGVFYHTFAEIYFSKNNRTWDDEEGTGYDDISEIPLKNVHVDTEKVDLGTVYYGFFDSAAFWDAVYKTEEAINDENGTILYSTTFCVNQSASWLDDVTFTIKDVTPPAYKKVFQDLIVPGLQERELKIKSQKTFSNPAAYYGFVPDVIRPYTDTPESIVTGSTKSLVAIEIETNRLVRVIKIEAVKNGNVLDTEYLISKGLDKNWKTLKSDEDIYKAARENAESQLWTRDMSVPEKIEVIADYIGSTTHYPGALSCNREYNPELWEAMGVDDKFLFYWESGDALLNRIMAFQGGLISCVAADILESIASEDLGIRKLDQDTCKTTTGEACWIGTGAESSNPANASHVTFYYRDANDRIYSFDVQGRGGGTYDAGRLIHFSDCTSENGFYHYVENVRTSISDAVVTGISAKTYTGEFITQTPVITLGSTMLTADTDYTESYSNNINAGTAAVIFTGIGDYEGTLTKTFEINPAPISTATVSGLSAKTYSGKAIIQTPIVKAGSTTLTPDTDYTISWSDNTNAGTATVTINGKGNYTGTKTATFKINKADQSITAKSTASSIAVGKTATVSITGNKGTKSYKSSNTAIAAVTSAGRITAKKVGTVTITAASAATGNYNAASKKLTIKVTPAATSSITAANQATGIKLAWKKVDGANGYLIYRGSTLVKKITSGSTVTFTDTRANTNGAKYTFKIVPTAGTGNGVSKSIVTWRLARPAISSVANSTSKGVTVKWGKNTKATGYQIQYSTSKTFASGNKTASVTKAETVSKVIGSLVRGKTYYVRIRTCKTVGGSKYYSLWSTAKSVEDATARVASYM